MQEIWVQAFAAVFEAVLIYYWVRAFSKNKANKRIQIIFEVAGVSVWIFISLVFLKNPLALISFTVIGCIVIFGIYHVPWKIGFVATLIFCVIMALCDVLSTYAVMMFSNESIEHIRFAPKYMLISNIITKFLLLSFVSFVYVHWKADINRLSMRRVIYLLILPIASIAILSQMLRFNDFDNPISIIMCVFGIVGLFIGNIYSFTFFEKEENLQKQQLRGLYLEQQIENQRLYYRNLEVSNEEIRKIRHDLKNAFAALSGYLNAENIEDAKKYVDKQVENLGELTYNTGHPAVDAVINNKKSRANELQIQFDVNIWLPEDLHIDEMDLCIILGNALDNALEACEKMPCGQGEIILSLRKTGEMLLINIKNTFDEKPVKDSDELVTTKKDQINHGFGLKTIHQLTKQYDGTMGYEVKNGWFCLSINLNFKDPVNSVR